MKKLLGLAVAMMLGLTLVGCEDTMEDTTIEEVETKQEEVVEEPGETLEDKKITTTSMTLGSMQPYFMPYIGY